MADLGGEHSRQREEQAEMPEDRNKLAVFKVTAFLGGEKAAGVVGDEMGQIKARSNQDGFNCVHVAGGVT